MGLTAQVPAGIAELELLDPAVRQYLQAALSSNTRRAYRSDLRHFIAWGGLIPSTDHVIAKYLADHAASLSMATLARRLVTIGNAHTTRGLPSPVNSELVRLTFRGIRHRHGLRQRQVAPVMRRDLLAMIGCLDESLSAKRDRALLLIGFAGAFRRSEIVSILFKDVQRVPEGIVITLRRSKTDQEGKGRQVGIPNGTGQLCPVRALDEWLRASGISAGPIFRPVNRHGQLGRGALCGQAVALIVKERAGAAGLDPRLYSGHSLRAGLVTSAAAAGVASWKIREQTGHASDAMLQRYIRDTGLFIDNATGNVL
jgi:integrase